VKISWHKLLLLIVLGLTCLTGQAQTPVQASGPLIVTDSNRLVSMRDGVGIALDIYRPAQNGSYPTLYASAPYPHTDNNTPPSNPMTGEVAWFVSQGFNYVIASTRGTGASQGEYEFLSRDEQQDHYEIIEWIAEQPWSDGRVLGIGAQYYASAQWQMAIQSPPSLQCIAPVNGIVRPYHDWAFPGGLSNTDFLQGWYENTVRRQNAFPTNGPSRLVNYDMRLQLLSHPFYDDFWRIRSSLPNAGAINIPVFIADSWQQGAGISGDLLIREQLNSIGRMAIYSETEALMLNPNFLEDDLLAFYRWCLQQESAPDFTARPALQYQIQGQSLWQTPESWPAAQVEHLPFYLNRQSLDATEPATLATEIQQNSLALSRYGDELDSLSFISEALAADLEIAGPLMLELYAASSQTDTAFSVSIEEEIDLNRLQSRFDLPVFLRNVLTASAQQNSETSIIQVTHGSLKASLREADARSVEQMDPRYAFSEADPLRAAEVTRFDIALNPSAYRFRAGSRIIVRITQATDDSLSTQSREDSLYHSERYPSRLWLPVQEGSLATTALEEDSLQSSIIDLQSEAITDPRAINFDLEFNRLLNENEP